MKIDLKTAEYIADKAQNDRSVFPIAFEECEKCGAAYIPSLGHDCNKIFDLIMHEVEEGDEITLIQEQKCCGTCRWLDADPFDGGPVCVNKESPYCAELWCPLDDTCDEWEAKDEQIHKR